MFDAIGDLEFLAALFDGAASAGLSPAAMILAALTTLGLFVFVWNTASEKAAACSKGRGPAPRHAAPRPAATAYPADVSATIAYLPQRPAAAVAEREAA